VTRKTRALAELDPFDQVQKALATARVREHALAHGGAKVSLCFLLSSAFWSHTFPCFSSSPLPPLLSGQGSPMWRRAEPHPSVVAAAQSSDKAHSLAVAHVVASPAKAPRSPIKAPRGGSKAGPCAGAPGTSPDAGTAPTPVEGAAGPEAGSVNPLLTPRVGGDGASPAADAAASTTATEHGKGIAPMPVNKTAAQGRGSCCLPGKIKKEAPLKLELPPAAMPSLRKAVAKAARRPLAKGFEAWRTKVMLAKMIAEMGGDDDDDDDE